MERQHPSVQVIVLSAALVLCLASGTAGAADIAWDLVSGTSQNLLSYGTDAPVFTSPGDGFQKFTVGVSPTVPFALVDDTLTTYPPDAVGVIDASSDFIEFFGVVDTENDDNAGPVRATWVFDISAAVENVELRMNLAAMGDFEDTDTFEWTYQIDSGSVVAALSAAADVDGSLTYTMADGTTRTHDDPLLVNGVTLSNVFQTFSIPITTGAQLTVVLTAATDGGSECYVVRNIMVTDDPQGPLPGTPIPALSPTGVAAMVLLLMAGGLILIRRVH